MIFTIDNSYSALRSKTVVYHIGAVLINDEDSNNSIGDQEDNGGDTPCKDINSGETISNAFDYIEHLIPVSDISKKSECEIEREGVM
jgi:hypothetical protein